MKILNILIVEDEIIIAETIKYYLEERGYNVLRIAISYDEAVQAYRLRCPDLVLLDIRLYDQKSGIDFANFLMTQSEAPPYIYLTSQYDQRILAEALKTNPSGYLTKPIQKETLWTSIEAAYQLFQFHYKEPEKIEISDGKENYKVNVNEILYIQADHVYSHIFLEKDKKLIIRKAKQYLHDLLSPTIFVRCHRSFIINTGFVKKWNKDIVEMTNGTIIPISKSYKDIVNNKLKD